MYLLVMIIILAVGYRIESERRGEAEGGMQ